MKKTISYLIFIVLFIMLTMAAWHSSSLAVDSEKTIEEGTYYIKSAINEKYVLDVPNGSKENGANIGLWSANNGDNQKFSVKYLGDGYYVLTNVNSNKVIDVYNNNKTPETNVEQYASNNGDNQKWLIKSAGDGYYYLISKASGLYMDVYNGEAKDGTNIQIYTKNEGKNQKFKFEPVNSQTKTETETSPDTTAKGEKTIEEGIYYIKSALNENYIFDIPNSSTANGANIALWKDNSGENQKFKVNYLGDGYYQILSVSSGKAVDVFQNRKEVETNVQQYEINGGDSQQWVIKNAGNGYYNLIAKSSGLYVDVYKGEAQNGSNVQLYTQNNGNNQKFKFELTGTKTIESGTYTIKSKLNQNYVLDVEGASNENSANVELWLNNGGYNQRFKIKYNNRGYYTITARHSGKALDILGGVESNGANVGQYTANNGQNQRWIIEKDGDCYRLRSLSNGVYLNVQGNSAKAGSNINVATKSNNDGQKFYFERKSNLPNIDTSKYPGYKERLEQLLSNHPDWEVEFLYTGLTFEAAVNGEYALRKRNLVPKSYGADSPWVADDDKTLYDTGWYAASWKAIAYQMDPRNFLNSTDIFEFKYVNEFNDSAVSISKLAERVSGTFLSGYGSDIYYACKNTNVDPYYVVARLIQEGGGATLKMERSEGTYYNPFNIGASGDGTVNVINNAYNTAKNNGWSTMQKAIEGGIPFLKDNYLENYQNTLYTNKFDIDKRSGGSLYTHQYMQNLFGAYNEARNLKSYYEKEGTIDSDFTFIIPVYENMSSTLSSDPTINYSTVCNFRAKIKTNDGDGCYVRSSPDTSSSSNIIGAYPDGTVVTVIDNVNYKNKSGYDWYKVVLPSGTQGFMPSKFLVTL